MPEQRRLLQVRLTDEARDGLDAFCYRRHVTVTAYLEAFGRLATRSDPAQADVIALARQIDRDRRSRR